MKKYIYFILIAISISGLSCMKDMTNLDITPVEVIAIDTAGLPLSFTVFQLDSLKIKPKAVSNAGLSTDGLKYEWGINYFGGYKRIVGTEPALATKITEAPGTYSLICTVTNPKTNLKSYFTWNITVNSPFGAGLIVADTRDDINSDYNLIMAFNFTPGIVDPETRIFRNLYSSANSQKIEGIVKSVGYMRYLQTDRILTGITDNAIIRVNALSYTFMKRDNDCFVLPPDKINPTVIQSVQPAATSASHEYIVNNGKVHGRYGSSVQFPYHLLGDKDYTCSKICALQSPIGTSAGALFYDDQNNRFLMTPWMVQNDKPLATFKPVDNSGTAPAFDPGNMGNKTCLHMEEGQANRILAVMKDRTSPNYFVYQVLMSSPTTGKMGYSLNDISNNPEIGSSKYYTCSSSENVLFYATDNHVYSSTLLVSGGSDATLRYTVPNGEKITGMQIHRKEGSIFLPSLVNPQDYSQRRSFAAANRMLILSTYNEGTKTGSIVTIPIETLGVGGLIQNPLYIKTYTGFGKITAFCYQNQ